MTVTVTVAAARAAGELDSGSADSEGRRAAESELDAVMIQWFMSADCCAAGSEDALLQ